MSVTWVIEDDDGLGSRFASSDSWCCWECALRWATSQTTYELALALSGEPWRATAFDVGRRLTDEGHVVEMVHVTSYDVWPQWGWEERFGMHVAW